MEAESGSDEEGVSAAMDDEMDEYVGDIPDDFFLDWEQCGDHDTPNDPIAECSEESMEDNAATLSETGSTGSEWTGFKLVLDNVDRSINPSFQRLDMTSELLHFVQVYAVLDRVDFSGLSDSVPVMISDVNPLSLLPSDDEIKKPENFCTTIISRLAKLYSGQAIIIICIAY